MNDITAALKDRAILLGWIAGLVLIISLLWSFTFPIRSACLMRAANKTLAMAEDPRRLSSSVIHPSVGSSPLGCWYTVAGSDSLFFVFTIIKEGILVPCGAEISSNGSIVEIIPLGSHARQVMDQIPQGMIQVYVHRIEAAARTLALGVGR